MKQKSTHQSHGSSPTVQNPHVFIITVLYFCALEVLIMGCKKVKGDTTKPKRQLIRTTIEKKKEIIAKYESGVGVTDIALMFKMPRTTISTIVRNKEAIKAASVAKGVKSVSKQRSQTLEEVEKLLYIWINEKQLAGDGISEAIICEKARQLHADLLKDKPGTSGASTEVFKASRGWFDKFKKRIGVHNMARCGEVNDEDVEVLVEEHRAELSTKELQELQKKQQQRVAEKISSVFSEAKRQKTEEIPEKTSEISLGRGLFFQQLTPFLLLLHLTIIPLFQELSVQVMMAGNLTNDQRKWILKQYWKTENAEKVRQKWAEEFDTPSPSRQTIYRIRDKFDKTGSICNAPKSGRPVSITTQENEMLVSQAFTESPKKSKQRASIELGISCRSLSRIMQRLGLKMYRPRLLHGLLEDDPDRRLQFCEVVLNEERQGNSIIDKITWSDEAHFKLSGAVYRHNCVYYSRENPHVMIEGQLNEPGITVWAGFSCKGILGPIFFHTTITQDLYLNMLKDTVLPQLQRQHDNDDYFFQQDEAHPHCAITVREFLDEQLPNRWIGRRGPVEWPPRSPDLTPMDFFFWGVVKDKVFSRKPHTVDDMISYIREACQEIDDNKELCAKVCSNIASILQECVNNEGRRFEPSRDCT